MYPCATSSGIHVHHRYLQFPFSPSLRCCTSATCGATLRAPSPPFLAIIPFPSAPFYVSTSSPSVCESAPHSHDHVGLALESVPARYYMAEGAPWVGIIETYRVRLRDGSKDFPRHIAHFAWLRSTPVLVGLIAVWLYARRNPMAHKHIKPRRRGCAPSGLGCRGHCKGPRPLFPTTPV